MRRWCHDAAEGRIDPGERFAGIGEAGGRRQSEPIACLIQCGRTGVDEPRELHPIAERLPDVSNPARAHVTSVEHQTAVSISHDDGI